MNRVFLLSPILCILGGGGVKYKVKNGFKILFLFAMALFCFSFSDCHGIIYGILCFSSLILNGPVSATDTSTVLCQLTCYYVIGKLSTPLSTLLSHSFLSLVFPQWASCKTKDENQTNPNTRHLCILKLNISFNKFCEKLTSLQY